MIKNIIFDFGDVFINLDKSAMERELKQLDLALNDSQTIVLLNNRLEVGAISTNEFLSGLQQEFPSLNLEQLQRIWNAILLEFPENRLEFLEALAASKKYRLFLLSNTNAIHIPKVLEIMGENRFQRFKACFEQFYLSHEIALRKPNHSIYEFVLQKNSLVPEETLFVDDSKDNTDAAKKLGIQVWNLQVGKEDIIDLKSKL